VNGENDLDVLRTLQGKKIIVDDIADAAVWINATTVTSADIVAENGIVHVIDGVLVPPMSLADTIEDRGLTTLGAALTQELSEGLALPSNPNTLLGPTDAAFTTLLGSLGISAAELLANDSLDEVLADHVVDLRAPASTVASLTASGVTTAGGNTYTVSTSDGIVLNSNAAVSARNIPYNGGVLHIIDAVLPANYVAPPVGTPEIGGPGVLLPAASN
jgi:transforming growth factor-beta-induced protein